MTKQLEQELTAWMRRQADQAPHDTDLEPGAFRKSRRIRVQRRITSAVVVTAVLGLAVPAGLQAINLATRPDHPQVADTPTTIETPTEAPVPSPVPTAPIQISFDQLPRGVTTLPWWSVKDQSIHDGKTLFPLKGEPGDIAKLGDRWYAVINVRKQDAVRSIELVGRHGRIPVAESVGYSLAISPNGEEIAWTAIDSKGSYSVQVASTETGKVIDHLGLGDRPDLSVVGFLGMGQNVLLSSAKGTSKSEAKFWQRPGTDSLLSVKDAAYAVATARNAPVVSILTHLQDDKTGNGRWCGAVMDGPTLQRLWESCDLMAVGISPDGRYALTQPSNTEGAGTGTLTIVDLKTGKTGLQIRADLLTQFAWEADSKHVVVEALIGGRSALVRSDVYGNLELISEPISYNFPDDNQPYVLGSR